MSIHAQIVTAELDHIPLIISRLRAADCDELVALSEQTPEQVLTQSFHMSRLAWTGKINGTPVCMFGVVKIDDGYGRPWMVGTDLLDLHEITFLRRCKAQVETMQSCFGRLENYVDVRNVRAICWLSWLGFSFQAPEPVGRFALPFMKFYREA